MTDTEPTITIAGLRAQIDSLETSLRGALDDVAAGEEVRLIRESEHAAVAAERTALAAHLADVRDVLARREAADMARDADESVSADQIAILRAELIQSRADLASERAHLAACKERIAGLERAADERSREDGARMDAIRAALGAHPFASDDHIADRIRAMTARVAELEARPGLTEFAGVSEDDLIRLFYVVGTDGIDHGEQCPPIDESDRSGIRAVLARLRVTLVKPVDPEVVAIETHNDTAYALSLPRWGSLPDSEQRMRTAAMRSALTSAGIPVTPERGK